MPFNGSGVFNLVYTFVNDAANGIKILASRQDTQWQDLATNGFGNTLTRDGQGSASANLPMNGFKHTNVANGSAATDYAAYGQLTTAVAAFPGFLGGLTLSTAGSSGTFGIAVGAAVDSTNALFMSLASAFTKTTGAFVAGTGNGALDASTIANSTWYHVFLIGDPLIMPDVLISLSATAPTLPAGYTVFRRIGAMKTDSSAHWIKFSQKGNQFLWSVPLMDVAGTVPASGAAASVALTTPLGVQTDALFSVRYAYNATVDYALITALDQADTQPGTGQFQAILQTTAPGFNMNYSVRTDTSQQIRVRICQNGGGGPTALFAINTNGWVDTRGQG